MRTSAWLAILLLVAGGCPPKKKKGVQAAADAPAVVASSAPATGTEPEPKRSPEERVNTAAALLTTGRAADAERALLILQEVVREEPSMVEAQFDMGVAYYQLGETKEAIRRFEDTIELDPTNVRAWEYLAAVQKEEGRTDRAIVTYREGISQHPEAMELRVGLVDTLRALGRPEDAVGAAKEALQVNAWSLPIYNSMGLAYTEMGDYQLAVFVFDKARQSIPGADQNAEIQANLGWTWFLLGDTVRSRFYLEKALELDPRLLPALVRLARLHLADEDYLGTLPLLESAAEQDPDNSGIQMNLGIAYRGVGRFDEAERAYKKALQITPSDPSPWFNLGILYGDYLKRYDDSIDAFTRYVSDGGPQAAAAEEYIESVKRERKKAERRRKQDQERQALQREVEERQRLLQQAEQEQEAPPGEETPAPEDAPTPEGDGSPWGETPEGQEGAE